MIALEGLIVGAVTGFVGAGGGFLIIPALVVLATTNEAGRWYVFDDHCSEILVWISSD